MSHHHWHRGARDGLALAGVRRQGTLLTSGTRRFLLLDPIRTLIDALDALNAAAEAAPDDLDRRMTAFAAFQRRLTEATGDVQSDEYLGGLVIHHATGIGIDVVARQGEEFFTPILYGDRAEGLDALEDSPPKEPLLPRLYANQFAGDRFPRQGARSHYVVGRGVYVVLDPPVVAALSVMERVNRSDRATRAAFRQDPMAHLMPELEKAGGDGSSVCDLKDYGERVLGIGLWKQARLSFKVPVSRQWFPENDAEVFTLELGGSEPLVVRREDVADLKRAVEEAEATGCPTFEFGGREHPLSPAAVDAVRTLAGCVAPEPKEPGTEKDALEEGPRLTAAITANNEEDLTFNATLRSARRHLRAEVDAIPILNRPMKHQRDGIQWLQTAFLSGMPGVLLADDMGLGKTFQVLAFMRWLRDGMRTGGVRRPFLVVAPKTLLGTWASEIEGHLGPGALGRELRVCESGLAALKVIKGRGSDIVLGTQTLDVGKIEDADLVLTTYETLRDYTPTP